MYYFLCIIFISRVFLLYKTKNTMLDMIFNVRKSGCTILFEKTEFKLRKSQGLLNILNPVFRPLHLC